MRNGYSKLKEEFPASYMQICTALGEAIRKDNENTLSQLIATYFSKPETINLLDGSIAVYFDDNEEAHFYPPAALAINFRAWGALRSILKVTQNPNARKDPNCHIPHDHKDVYGTGAGAWCTTPSSSASVFCS